MKKKLNYQFEWGNSILIIFKKKFQLAEYLCKYAYSAMEGKEIAWD